MKCPLIMSKKVIFGLAFKEAYAMIKESRFRFVKAAKEKVYK